MVIWRSPLLNGYPLPLADPTTWRLEMQHCVMADGGMCTNTTTNNQPPTPLIFHNKSPYDGLNKRRAPAAFVLSGADLNPTLIVSHYKEENL